MELNKPTIVFEDADFEKGVLEDGCIAVPVEISLTQDGELSLCVYSFCRDAAEAFIERFSADPFSDEALAFVSDALSEKMAEMDFELTDPREHEYFEYRCTDPDTSKILADCDIIDTLKGEKWDNLELDEFELEKSDPTDRMAVIRRDRRIVCYAGINDISDGDGMYELTVECEEEYRRRGFASSCIAAMADHLIRLGEGVKYVTAGTNTASQHTAASAGFVLCRKVLSFVCYRNVEDEGEAFNSFKEV